MDQWYQDTKFVTNEEDNNRVVHTGPCIYCSSSDAYKTYADGHSFCFSCETYTPSGDKPMAESVIKMETSYTNTSPKVVGVFDDIKDRGLKRATLEHYGVRVQKNADGEIVKHLYPYYDKNNIHISNKVRNVADKQFLAEPSGSLGRGLLFGQNICQEGGKFVTVCEGEIDAMSAYQMMGSQWPVVSIKDGAASAVRNCKNSYAFLNSYDHIRICFDNDERGIENAAKVASLFEPNKCSIVNLSLKDANEYLKAGKSEEFVQKWWAAKVHTPAGIVNLKDIGPDLYKETNQSTCLYPFTGLNEKLYGIRTGELLTLTAGTGTGKSSVMRELIHHVLKNTAENIGIISLEESNRSTVFHLMSVEASDRLYINEVRAKYSQEELNKWEQATIGTGRLYAFDHFGSLKTEEILSRVRYMIKALDCKWIFLDHLSILVSGLEGMDERRNIDILMTKLRSLVEETNCALILVSHLRRANGDSGHEDGKEVSLSHLRGSQSIAQLSDAVVALERDQQADDQNAANTTTVRVLKNRYAGETGVACYLYFNRDTGRLAEVENLGDSDGAEGFEETVL